MKLLVFAGLVLFGSMSFGQTKYDRIKELFDTGSTITTKELNDVWRGRCFSAKDRDYADPSVFGIPQVQDLSAGPEFAQFYTMLLLSSYKVETRAEAMEEYMVRIEPNETPTGLVIAFEGRNYVVRKNGSYIMLANISDDQYCYYWEPLK